MSTVQVLSKGHLDGNRKGDKVYRLRSWAMTDWRHEKRQDEKGSRTREVNLEQERGQE